MQRLSITTLPALLLLAACGEGQPPAANETAAAPAGPASATPIPSVSRDYDCEPAMKISVLYDNSDPAEPEAIVTVDGRVHEMDIARSASGARYETDDGRAPGKTLIWWNKGNEGTLLEGDEKNPAASETMLAACVESA